MNLAWLWVGVVYTIAIALARRARVDLPKRVALSFYALVLLFFWKPLTGPYVNVAPDVLNLIAPWSASAPPGFDKYSVSNYELQDVVFQFVPWTRQVHESWRSLHVPLWNPLAACGMPLMANMQSGALSPLRLLTIPLPLAHAFSAEAAMKVLVALTFAFLFCRRRYDVVPSMIGAIAFGFGTFMTLWLHFPHPNVAAFFPAVLYMLDLLAERVTRGRFVFAALLGPILLAGGHPETVAHTVFFAALYALWLMFVERKKLFATLVAVSIASLLLSLPILLPFVEILPHSMSYRDAKALAHHEATAYSDFASLALLVHPRIYGQRPGPLWGPNVTEAAAGFAGLLGFGACLALLMRAVAQRRFRETETFFLLATLFMFALIADVPVISAPVRALFSLALNSRFRLQFAFLLAMQTAALVHHARRERWLIAPAIAGAIAPLAFVLLKTSFPSPETQRFALVAAIPSLVTIALLPFRFARPLLIVAIYVELWMAGHSWHPVHRKTEIYARTPLIDAVRGAIGNEPWRVVGLGGMLFPNTNAPFGLEDVRVKDALASARYVDLLRANVKGFDTSTYYWKWNDADTPLLDRLGVRYVIAEPRTELSDRTRYALIYDGYDGRVYENRRAMPRFFAENARVAITKWRGDRYELVIDADRETIVQSSVAMWPGWRVAIGDRRGQLLDGPFLSFRVPAGTHVVRVRYVPRSFWGGLVVALLTLVALLTIRRSHANRWTSDHQRRASAPAGGAPTA